MLRRKSVTTGRNQVILFDLISKKGTRYIARFWYANIVLKERKRRQIGVLHMLMMRQKIKQQEDITQKRQ